jgi:glucosamine-6-phosphate deaminase
MASKIDFKDLYKWCQIPVDKLENHPDLKMKLKIFDTKEEVIQWAADDLVQEVKQKNEQGKPTRWILPCGPTKQYPIFADVVNKERISLKNTHIFHMDDLLDWQTQLLPLDHPLSFQGWMRRRLYDLIDPELGVPEEQRHFPNPSDIDSVSRGIQAVGGVDAMYTGVGYHGHIAYNEPPYSPWNSITNEEFKNSKSRILPINVDTTIAISQREMGGCSQVVPPMGITIGMKDMLCAKRIRLLSVTGSWKRTVLRIALFGPVTLEYPVTFVQEHPDSMLIVDRDTIEVPFSLPDQLV